MERKGKENSEPRWIYFVFFKAVCEVVGKDVITAIKYFFRSSVLRIGVSLNDFRPISPCNLLYKFITKIMENWLKRVMDTLVSLNLTVFIQGRSIVENIMMSHEVAHSFERKSHAKAAILKIDLREAYDLVSWEFVRETLEKMNFPNQFIEWVMECISSPIFSVLINGSPKGFF